MASSEIMIGAPSQAEFSQAESQKMMLRLLTLKMGAMIGDAVFDPVDGIRIRQREEGSKFSRPIK